MHTYLPKELDECRVKSKECGLKRGENVFERGDKISFYLSLADTRGESVLRESSIDVTNG